MIPLMQNDLNSAAYFLIYFLQERKEMLALHTISFLLCSQWIYHLAINIKVKQQNKITGNGTFL